MIRLLPYFRLYGVNGARFLEATLSERAVPLDDALFATVRRLARGPVASSADIDVEGAKGALSLLRGLGLIAVGDERPEDGLGARLAEGTPALPWVDNVELTNICPMECVMCPTGTGRMTRPKGHMDVAVFQRLVDELTHPAAIAAHGGRANGGKPIALHNLGESTLHPRLAELVAYAASRGLVTELSANPGHLPLALFRALEDAGLARLVISLDGVDAETLTRIRGKGARADRAFAHLDAIFADRRARVARGDPVTTRVLVQLIRQRGNAAHVAPFLARFGSDGAGGAGDGLPLTSAYVKELDANTVDARAGTDEGLVEIGRPARPSLCRAPWRTVVVLHNGDVVPCCHDANGAVVYGSLASSSLADIWAGDVARGLRARLAGGAVEPSDPCSGCAHRPDRFPMPVVGARLEDIPEEPLHW